MTTNELKMLCDSDDSGACLLLAGRYKFGARDTPKEPETSAYYHQRSCQLGSTDGCVQLGYLYVKGFGVPIDWSRAFALFNDACSTQSANGCDSLGEAYEKGWGVPVDPAKAHDSYRKACALDESFCR